MFDALLERRYHRLGARYLQRTLFLQQGSVLIVLPAALGLLSLYVPMSFGQYVGIAAVGCGLQMIFMLLTDRIVGRLVRPVVDWLEDGRDDRRALAAWRAAAALPHEVVRRQLLSRTLGVALWSAVLIATLYMAIVLDLSVGSAAIVYTATSIVVSYAAGLRFFAIERIERPVLADIGQTLAEGAAPSVQGPVVARAAARGFACDQRDHGRGRLRPGARRRRERR